MNRDYPLPAEPKTALRNRPVVALELIKYTKCPLCHSKPISVAQKSEYGSYQNEPHEEVEFACGGKITFTQKNGYDTNRECGHIKDIYIEMLKLSEDQSQEQLLTSDQGLLRIIGRIRRDEEETHERRIKNRNEIKKDKRMNASSVPRWGNGDP